MAASAGKVTWFGCSDVVPCALSDAKQFYPGSVVGLLQPAPASNEQIIRELDQKFLGMYCASDTTWPCVPTVLMPIFGD